MEFHEVSKFAEESIHEIAQRFQKLPGSAILIRYIQSSYQNDPVRSAIELILVIFFVRYLLSPSYPTHSGNFVKLTEDVRIPEQSENFLLTKCRRLTNSWMNGTQSLSSRHPLLSKRLKEKSFPLLSELPPQNQDCQMDEPL
jgi:hypothetical protein